MRTASRFVIVIILLGVVLGGIFGYKFYQFGQMKEKMSQPQPPTAISATDAKVERWTPSIKAVGSIEAVNGVQVANEVPGVIQSIEFESGDTVKEGDILIRLNSEIDEAPCAPVAPKPSWPSRSSSGYRTCSRNGRYRSHSTTRRRQTMTRRARG
jgi:membrane fusion protein (multidrug efflux system)